MAGLFGKPPKPEDPVRMPDPEDPRVKEAVRDKQADMLARHGRQSTILSDSLGDRFRRGSAQKQSASSSTIVGSTPTLGAGKL